MLYTDYKFSYILEEGGSIIEAKVRFYEGSYVIDPKEGVIYKRIAMLREEIFAFPLFSFVTRDYLVSLVNKELAKDKDREVVNEQEIKI